MMIGMWLFWIILIGLVVWAIVEFMKRNSSFRQEDPLSIAKVRYAKGEISKKEYETMIKELKKVNT